MKTRLAAACLALAGALPAQARPLRHSGDLLSYALPVGVMAREGLRGDGESARQFGGSFLVTLGATEVLKRTLDVPRPDGSDTLSFPSGHAARAFSAAAYVHRRYGAHEARPFYAAAAFVGYTRVEARRHRWVDVAGAAALSLAVSKWLVKPKRDDAIGRAEPVSQAGPPPLLTFTAAW